MGLEGILRKSLGTTRQKLFECTKCRKKYLIPGAKDSGLYKCVSCNLVMSEARSGTHLIESTDAELVLDEILPEEVRQAMKNPESVIGRFVILEQLSADETYRAFDVELMRQVEIRFVNETLAADLGLLAAIEHKHIARVYDIGSVGGKGFVTSQLIQGKTVDAADLPLEAIAEVCDALDYAHNHGVPHGNISAKCIIIDTAGNVFLTGFGSIGKADLRSDIIAAAQLVRGTNPELRAISQKDDYPSAGHIAADIRRYIRGYPVSAYGSSIAYRIEKSFRRNKLVFAACGVLIFAVTAAGFIFIEKSREAKRLEAEQQRHEAERNAAAERDQRARLAAEKEKQAAEKLMAALLSDLSTAHEEAIQRRRSGDRFANLRKIPDRILNSSAYNHVRERANADAKFHFSMGRLYRIIGDDESASKEQLESLKLDPNFGEAHYEIGMILYAIYRGMLVNLRDRMLKSPQAYKPADANKLLQFMSQTPEGGALTNETVRKLKAEIKQHFDSALKLLSDPAKKTAITALYSANYDQAKSLLDQAKSVEDAVSLLASIYVAENDVKSAIAVLSNAIEQDRGNTSLISMRTNLYLSLGNEMLSSGQNAMKCYDLAMKDCDLLDELHPEKTAYYIFRATAHLNQGAVLQNSGKDPRELYRKSAAEFDKVLAVLKNDWESWLWRGNAFMNLGIYEMSCGSDPGKEFSAAVESLERSLECDKTFVDAYLWRGGVHLNWGLYMMQSGQDPTREYDCSISDYKKALEIQPETPAAWSSLGNVYMNRGVFNARDSISEYREAIKCFDSSIKLDASRYRTWMLRGMAAMNIGASTASTGADPSQFYAHALDDFKKSHELNGADFETWMWSGYTRGLWLVAVQAEFTSGADVQQLYSDLLHDFDESLKLNPSYAETYSRRGTFRFFMDDTKEALADFEKSYSLNPLLLPQYKDLWDKAKKKLANDF